MPAKKQGLVNQLVKVRQHLKNIHIRVGALETQLLKERPDFTASQADEDPCYHLFDNMLEGCQIIGYDWRCLYINAAAAHHDQKTKEELLGYTMMERYPGIEQTAMFAVLQRCMQQRTVDHIENTRNYPDGTTAWFELRIEPVPEGIFILSLDITGRKQADEHIHRLHRTLGVLSDINQAIVRIRHLPTLFERACEIAVEKGAFRMAWIGLLDLPTGHINPVACAGAFEGYLEKLNTELTDVLDGAHPLTTPVRTGERRVCNDLQNNPQMLTRLAESQRLGYRSSIAFPLMAAGEVRGVLALYAAEPDFFDHQELQLIEEMAMDISFAIEITRQDEQRHQTELSIQHYAQRMETLHEIDTGLVNANSVQDIVETALKHIRQLIPCQRANVGLLDRATGEGVIFALDLDHETALGQGLRIKLAQLKIKT